MESILGKKEGNRRDQSCYQVEGNCWQMYCCVCHVILELNGLEEADLQPDVSLLG
jgi:hypothetical protein